MSKGALGPEGGVDTTFRKLQVHTACVSFLEGQFDYSFPCAKDRIRSNCFHIKNTMENQYLRHTSSTPSLPAAKPIINKLKHSRNRGPPQHNRSVQGRHNRSQEGFRQRSGSPNDDPYSMSQQFRGRHDMMNRTMPSFVQPKIGRVRYY